MRSLREFGRCRGAKSAPRSKERWLASGRQVEGKHQVAGNATLIHDPVGAMTREAAAEYHEKVEYPG